MAGVAAVPAACAALAVDVVAELAELDFEPPRRTCSHAAVASAELVLHVRCRLCGRASVGPNHSDAWLALLVHRSFFSEEGPARAHSQVAELTSFGDQGGNRE